MKIHKLRNFIPKYGTLRHSFTSGLASIGETLTDPRKRLFVAAFSAAGAIGGAGLCYGLSELGQKTQMEIRNITAAEYDARQPRDTAVSALFYGIAGCGYGLAFAPLVPARRRETLAAADRADHARQPRFSAFNEAIVPPVPGPIVGG